MSNRSDNGGWMTHEEYVRFLAMSFMWVLLWLKIDQRMDRRYHHMADDAWLLNEWYWQPIWGEDEE